MAALPKQTPPVSPSGLPQGHPVAPLRVPAPPPSPYRELRSRWSVPCCFPQRLRRPPDPSPPGAPRQASRGTSLSWDPPQMPLRATPPPPLRPLRTGSGPPARTGAFPAPAQAPIGSSAVPVAPASQPRAAQGKARQARPGRGGGDRVPSLLSRRGAHLQAPAGQRRRPAPCAGPAGQQAGAEAGRDAGAAAGTHSPIQRGGGEGERRVPASPACVGNTPAPGSASLQERERECRMH